MRSWVRSAIRQPWRTMPWGEWLRSPAIIFGMQTAAVLIIAHGIVHMVSSPQVHVLAMSWVVFMTIAHLVCLALQTRWWLSSLVGLVLWQSGMLAFCLWSLTMMVTG